MQEISKTYNASDWEDTLYKQWEDSGYFNPDAIENDERYCNVLPPPNANGELHLGHASGYTVMDIFGRYQRMLGKKVLLLPGKDHAGIQTQVVFEKKLKEDGGLSRYDLGQKKFFEECFAFCSKHADYMRSQEKRIGISADWSREKFTLDPQVSKIALETFVQMHQDGLVYRGNRITNWCPRCATALSDIEVIHKEIEGKMYFIKYPLKDSSEFITVATTRPETMLGDSAVAVHTRDDRYEHLIGKLLVLPLLNREIPLIADERIDREFGTGAVKITPAHDPLDWRIGKDHHLAEIHIIDENATITSAGEKYAGMTTLEAREAVISDLSNLGLVEKIKNHTLNISLCERCKTVIEPLISKQWFINVDAPHFSLKKEALKTLKSNAIHFYPKQFKGHMEAWLERIEDWCISRQIWWGHRIPVWYCDQCEDDTYVVSLEQPDTCPHCDNTKLRQESDTFDTWFSSGQWPYTTLGYPENQDAITFFPTDMMIMGRDLLFFWASRMLMMSLYRTRKIPFKNLHFTGLIRDKNGHKMSKSKGNGIDVLKMIDKFGADAVRLSMISDTAPGQDSRLYEEKIESFRNFSNKLWNIGRYVMTQSATTNNTAFDAISTADYWILRRLSETIHDTTTHIDHHNLSFASEILRSFTWNDFADWYIEMHKIEKNDALLRYVFETLLKLWHPFMPFVTEALWQQLRQENSKLLMIEAWPEDIDSVTNFNNRLAAGFEHTLQPLIVAIRNIRATYRIDPVKKVTITLITPDSAFLETQTEIIQRLARVETLHILADGNDIPKQCAYALIGDIKLYVHLEGILDVHKEKAHLQKELEQTKQYVVRIETQLDNPHFVSQAPEAIITKNKEELQKSKDRVREIENHLTNLL
jgi:valyl-tRNA synthetase